MEVGRVLVQDVHHFLRTRAVERRLAAQRRGPGRRSPGAPTTAVPRRWCRQPRPSRRSSPRTGWSRRRRRRLTAMRHRRRPGWLAPSMSASPRLSGTTVATRTALGPPPLPLQPVSLDQTLPAPRVRAVPPTDRTFGEAAGHEAGAPASPEDATNATPAWSKSAVVRRLARELAAAPAHRHDIRMGRRVVDGGEQVGITGRSWPRPA